MKEYEIVAKYLNGCAGAAHPQTFFEEAELASTDEFVRMKHRGTLISSSRKSSPAVRWSTPTTTELSATSTNLPNYESWAQIAAPIFM